MDPVGRARDQLRERIVRELEAAGLAYVSPAERATTLTAAQVGASPARADAYVAQRRPRYPRPTPATTSSICWGSTFITRSRAPRARPTWIAFACSCACWPRRRARTANPGR